MPSDTSFLSLRNIRKQFGAFVAIENLSIDIQKGEFISILGPSGCGKTTLLRTIAGFFSAEGEIWLDGMRIDALASHKRGATMVFQNYALFPHMTVFENVAFGLRRQRLSTADIIPRVDEVLALVRLKGFEGRYPRQLSGGQQQRVALARAVVVRPKLLLLDEPLSNLDAKLRSNLREEFLRIHRATGTTSVFVTHDQEEAFSLSDRVALMNSGRVEQFDTPRKMFSSPATSFVSEFIGHTNIVEGEVRGEANGPYIVAVDRSIRVPAAAQVGRAGRFAIPLHLVNVTREPKAADNCFEVKLTEMSYLGPSVRGVADLAGLRIVWELPSRRDSLNLKEDDTVYVSWMAEDMIGLPTEGMHR
jgi:putative spermidine/putrescine transport system ATP-binding protein